MSFKNAAGPSVLSLCLLAALATPARADRDDRDDRCRRDVHKAEERLEKAIRKHGEHSRQADARRHQLEEARERCHMRGEDREHGRDPR
jgi:hypothetical protein